LDKRIWLLTGNPGVGKTTVMLKVVEGLKINGYNVGGMISREVRSLGERVGFEVLDLSSGKRGWLAHVNQPSGPRIGKYRVNLNDLDNVGAEAIVRGVEGSDFVCVDEIGPMELLSEKFKEAVRRAVKSEKLLIGIVHWRAKDRLIDEAKAREDAEIIVVTNDNRNKLHEYVLEKAMECLKIKK
jgi:nucleoside-triphosphatase